VSIRGSNSTDGRADLLDFFPVWLDIGQTLAARSAAAERTVISANVMDSYDMNTEGKSDTAWPRTEGDSMAGG
jgi:hypothetical protein